MGFFSGLFGSASEWDGSRYIEKMTGTKFWHERFIDKDEMKRHGQFIAHQIDPLGPRLRAQSQQTIIGELIFLLKTTEQQNEVLVGGKIPIRGGCVQLSSAPGLDVERLSVLHEAFLRCRIRTRNDVAQMQRYRPDWRQVKPRF